MIKLIVRNIKAGILFIYILSRLIFADISFSLIYFPGYKFCHISCGFIFINGEILIIWGGRVFMVTRYIMFMSGMVVIPWKKQTFAKFVKDVPKMY